MARTRASRGKSEGGAEKVGPRPAPSGDPDESVTLAEFSARHLKKKLDRCRGRGGARGKGRGKRPLLPGPAPSPASDDVVGSCGARAKAKGDKAGRRGPGVESGTDRPEEDEADVEWEDIDEEGEGEGEGAEDEQGGGEKLRVDVDVNLAVDDPLADRSFVRLWAILVHRAHVLCLLGRGMHCDKVASDPVLQGRVLSVVPEWLLSNKDVPRKDQLTASNLLPVATFLRKHLGGGIGEGGGTSRGSLSLGERLSRRFGKEAGAGPREDLTQVKMRRESSFAWGRGSKREGVFLSVCLCESECGSDQIATLSDNRMKLN